VYEVIVFHSSHLDFRLCEHWDFVNNPCGIPLDREATYTQD
jgi:hypothetical protein